MHVTILAHLKLAQTGFNEDAPCGKLCYILVMMKWWGCVKRWNGVVWRDVRENNPFLPSSISVSLSKREVWAIKGVS